jgi:hypothetical protein
MSTYVNKDLEKFTTSRLNAERRGIAFELTFEQWFDIWTKSGHYSERGRKRGQYVMARFGDEGPYAVGNVEINVSKGQANRGCLTAAGIESIRRANSKPHPWLADLNRSRTGQPRSLEHRQNIARTMTGKKRGPYRKKVKE